MGIVKKKVCTNNEFFEIKNLEVKSAIYFFDSDFVLDFEEYLNCILADEGSYSYSQKLNSRMDTRTYKTFLFPLKEFIGPLVEKRGQLN